MQRQHLHPAPAPARLHAVQVADDLVAPPGDAVLGDDAGQLEGVQQDSAAHEGVEVPGRGLQAAVPVGEGPLGEVEVVAVLPGGAEGLAAGAGQKPGGLETEVELLVQGPEIGRLGVGKVAELVLVLSGEPQLGVEGGGGRQDDGQQGEQPKGGANGQGHLISHV